MCEVFVSFFKVFVVVVFWCDWVCMSMCVCMYIYMHICMCLYICVCLFVCLFHSCYNILSLDIKEIALTILT